MKTTPLVYLAGPITGLNFDECTDWREDVKAAMPSHIDTLSPLRGKQYLKERSNRDGRIMDSYEEYPLSSSRGINTRDHWDVMRSSAVLVNMLGAAKASLGTVMEIAWAFAYRVPLVLVMEKEGNIHDHSMIRESTGFRVDTLEKGIEVIVALLSTDRQIQEFRQKQEELDFQFMLRHHTQDRGYGHNYSEPRTMEEYKKRSESHFPNLKQVPQVYTDLENPK